MRIIILLVLLACSAVLFGQKISGFVKDETGRATDGAVVSLLKQSDSSAVKWAIADETGHYTFLNIKPGSYSISATRIGHTPAFLAAVIVDNVDITAPELVLTKLVGKLKEVTVTAQKPLIEIKADKTILNVDGTINAIGTDALELLRKSPGIMVDKDDKISMNGKSGVQVLIDGRSTHLSGDDLSRYLKTIQSSQIESVQLISNPSARYDATGNAGIINIIVKKNKAFGTNGSVNGGWNIGTNARYNTGVAFNHRNKKLNLFGNYTWNTGRNFSSMNIYRTIPDTLFDQHGTGYSKNAAHTFKTGVDFFPNKNTTIGAMVTGSFSDLDYKNNSTTPIVYLPTITVNRIQISGNNNVRHNENMNVNLNYTRTASKGKTLSVNADYGFHHLQNDQWQPNDYYDATGATKLYSSVIRMNTPSDIDIYAFKADYEQNLGKGKLETGGKTGFVNTINDLKQFDIVGGDNILDKDRSNRFSYKENINAVYASYSRPFKGLLIQAGLRIENTNLEGTSMGLKKEGINYINYDSTFNRRFTDVFPSASVTFNKNPMNQLSITYSRRIDRPSYKDLNPFQFRLDAYTFTQGNIHLRPQYTNSFGITHTYKYKLTTSVNFSIVKDMFTALFDTTETSKLIITNRNLATQKVLSANVSYVFNFKSYTGIVNVNSNYSHYKADMEERTINLNAVTFGVYAQNSIVFGKTYTAQITGVYNAPSVYMGTFKANAIWSVDAGLQKKIWKGKATVKTSVSDLFRTLRYTGTTDFVGQKTISASRFESRQFKLGFIVRFGNNQVKTSRQRSTGAEDENKRVQQGGNGFGLN
jgi:iron complex outermembrane receptor protein